MIHCFLLDACSFLIRDRTGGDLEESWGNEEQGGVKRRENRKQDVFYEKRIYLNKQKVYKYCWLDNFMPISQFKLIISDAQVKDLWTEFLFINSCGVR